MELDLVGTSIGLITLAPLVLVFFACANWLPLGALSLPCMTIMTSFIYFYLMPTLTLATGDPGYFGMYLTSLDWLYFAVLLYSLGAIAAFFVQRRALMAAPGAPKPNERQMVEPIFYALWAIAAAGFIVQIVTGKLNLSGSENYEFAADKVGELAFVTQTYNIMIPLTLIVLIRDNFKLRSLALLVVILFVFLQIGFRFRLMIMLAAVASSFVIVRGTKMRVSYTIAGAVIAIALSNLVGSLRRYGQGLNLSNFDDVSTNGLLTSFGGEFGIVYTLAYAAENPLPYPVMFEPWVVGIARLIPSFIWQDKPTAEYLGYFIEGATTNAKGAGVAVSQHVEMLLQFGWIGLPFLAFFYFNIAAYLISCLHRLGREARIAGCALVPAYFGFYMQTRGYFFQIFVDSLFFFGPLFLVHVFEKQLGLAPASAVRQRLFRLW